MGICRNCHGKLSYTATNSHKQVFSVTVGDNHIVEYRPYLAVSNPWYVEQGMFFDMPKFESFIHAVKFLKDHLEDIL